METDYNGDAMRPLSPSSLLLSILLGLATHQPSNATTPNPMGSSFFNPRALHVVKSHHKRAARRFFPAVQWLKENGKSNRIVTLYISTCRLLANSSQIIQNKEAICRDNMCVKTNGGGTIDKKNTRTLNLTCKRGSMGLSQGLLIPRSSFRFSLNPEN